MSNTISRRTLAKGAAWSVPAVVAANSVPALAASPSRDCEQGPYLRVEQPMVPVPWNPDVLRPDSSMEGFTDSSGDPLQRGEYAEPRDAELFRVNLRLITTGELAADAQIIMTLQWEQIDTWYVENPEDPTQPLEQEKITTTLPTGDLIVARGNREDETLTPLTEVTVSASPGGSTSRTITFTLEDAVATEREIPLVIILPGDPVEPGEMESTGGYEELRNIRINFTAMAMDNSGCSYEAISGFWYGYTRAS